MEFKKIESPSLTDLFVTQIEDMVISGKLAAGDKLPTERELAAQMGVSVAVINGGIMRLAKLGFLRVAPRKGVFVEDYIRNGNAETLEVLLKYSGEYYRADMQHALLDYRRVIETRAIERLVKSDRDDPAESAERILEKLKETRDEREFIALAYEIHHELVLCGGNVIDSLVFTSFRPIYESFYRVGLAVRGREEIIRFFTRQLDALRAKDLDAALAELNNSLALCKEAFDRRFSEGQRYN